MIVTVSRVSFILALTGIIPSTRAEKLEELTGPSGYIYTAYGNGDDHVTFGEAEFQCLYKGFDGLVLIKYPHIETEVQELMDGHGTRNSFIGMLDIYTEGYWYWLDGSKTTAYYENWGSGEPTSSSGEDCGAFRSPANYWLDLRCSDHAGYICFSAPQICQSANIPLRNREFLIRNIEIEQGTLEMARRKCEESGYRLAHVDSIDALEKIKEIGIWDPSLAYWVDGTQTCLNSEACNDEKHYVCEAVLPSNMALTGYKNDYRVGDAIHIECSSFGLPTPMVTWHKGVHKLTDKAEQNTYQVMEPGKSTLIIKSARLEDASRYRCFATNEIHGQENIHKTYVDIRIHSPALTKQRDD